MKLTFLFLFPIFREWNKSMQNRLLCTLIFCEAYSDQLRYLSWLFMWFEAPFGLKVNMDKSEVILVGGRDIGGCCFGVGM